jgi:hypothetical protein
MVYIRFIPLNLCFLKTSINFRAKNVYLFPNLPPSTATVDGGREVAGGWTIASRREAAHLLTTSKMMIAHADKPLTCQDKHLPFPFWVFMPIQG